MSQNYSNVIVIFEWRQKNGYSNLKFKHNPQLLILPEPVAGLYEFSGALSSFQHLRNITSIQDLFSFSSQIIAIIFPPAELALSANCNLIPLKTYKYLKLPNQQELEGVNIVLLQVFTLLYCHNYQVEYSLFSDATVWMFIVMCWCTPVHTKGIAIASYTTIKILIIRKNLS